MIKIEVMVFEVKELIIEINELLVYINGSNQQIYD